LLLFIHERNQHDALHLAHRIVFEYLLLSTIFVFSCVLWFVTWKCLLASERRRTVNEQNISFRTILHKEAAIFSEILVITYNSTRPHIPKTRIFLIVAIRIPNVAGKKKTVPSRFT